MRVYELKNNLFKCLNVENTDYDPGVEKIMPYNDAQSKGLQVESMFDSIAPAYDLMNSIMSLGMHTRWRDKGLDIALSLLDAKPQHFLDVATGTGDLVFALHKRCPDVKITGIDLSEGMLSIARSKLSAIQPDLNTDKNSGKHDKSNDSSAITFQQADCLRLPFADKTFDLVTVAYGVRNFEDIPAGMAEMYRVTRPGGVICVIELSTPVAALPLAAYRIYTRGLIPLAGRIISHDPRAYSYLHESIEAAPQRAAMTALMEQAGFSSPQWKSIFPGVVCIYTAIRNHE